MKIEDRIARLERGLQIPGTVLQRIMMDNALCEKEGIIPTGRESTLVWSLGLGAICAPKKFFRGVTIEETVTAAERELLIGEVIETALVFDKEGKVIHWHLPPNRTGISLPDSQDLWAVIWENRKRLGGVAHTHPWKGATHPSHTDVTTFAAVEAGLGRRLLWPIVTFDQVVYLKWAGPGKWDYGFTSDGPRVEEEAITELRKLSGKE